MRAREFLLEYNMEALLKNFGDKLLAKWKEEEEPFKDEILDELNLEVDDELTSEQLVKWIERFDPTQNSKYITWIIGKYAGKKGGINRLEDMTGRMRDNLETYERLSRRKALEPEHAQITKIKTLPDLEDIVDSYQEVDTASQAESGAAEEQAFYDSDGAEMIYNGDDYKIVIPKTTDASCYFGKNTRWCTASRSHNYFNSYSKDGPLYVILHKASNSRWQFHFESRQYMDERDMQIDIKDFVKTHKKAMNKIISHHGDMDSIATQDPKNWFEYLKNPSEAATMAAMRVYKDGRLVMTVKDPSDKLKLAAIHQTPQMIQMFPDVSDKLKKAAVTAKPLVIQYIDPQTPELQMIALKYDSEAIRVIKDPSPEAQAQYVKQSRNKGANIKVLDNPHPLAQMAAVEQSPERIKDIKNPAPEVQLFVVQRNGLYITYIDNPTDEAQLAAVKNDPHALRHIKNPSGQAKKWLRHNTESFDFDLKELQHLSGIK